MMTTTLEFEEADARFFELIEKASRGEQTTVTRQGRIVARILPPGKSDRVGGLAEGSNT